MSLTVEIENPANLIKARNIAGVNSDKKAVEIALERFVRDYEPKPAKEAASELPETFWDDLFSQPMLPSSVIKKAIEDEREDRF